MRKLASGLVAAAMFVAAPVVAPSVASADPGPGEIWKCWYVRSNSQVISRDQYWSCIPGQVHRVSTYDGRLIAKYDAYCANGVWNRDRSATWVDMINYCPSDGRPRS